MFENHKIVDILDEITPGCEETFLHGIATEKYDGSCCAIINGELYKRYDAKAGKTPPEGAIACDDPDPITGHWPHWAKVDIENPRPSDKWFVEAYLKSMERGFVEDGTYEAVGPHFNGNPYKEDSDRLILHGCTVIHLLPRTFEDIKKFLKATPVEGIVFWLNGEPVCKIKRTDFGFEWPIKKG